MTVKLETKFNIGDIVRGDVSLMDNGFVQYRKIEGKVHDITIKYGYYSDKDYRDKVVTKKQYIITYNVYTDSGHIFTIDEKDLTAIKRTLDYFTTKELETELELRKQNLEGDRQNE